MTTAEIEEKITGIFEEAIRQKTVNGVSYALVDRQVHRFVYRAAKDESEAMQESLTAKFAAMCDMHKGEMLLRLLDDLSLSRSDLEAIAKKAAEKAKTAPEKVGCNCLSTCEHMEGEWEC